MPLETVSDFASIKGAFMITMKDLGIVLKRLFMEVLILYQPVILLKDKILYILRSIILVLLAELILILINIKLMLLLLVKKEILHLKLMKSLDYLMKNLSLIFQFT